MKDKDHKDEDDFVDLECYVRRLTLKNIKRETFLIEQYNSPASRKFSTVLKNSDEELAEWIYQNNIKSWKKLGELVEERSKVDDKEEKITEIIQTPRKTGEDMFSYAERLINIGKLKGLKERTIIVLLGTLIGRNESFKLEINNARNIEDALYRISLIHQQLALKRKNTMSKVKRNYDNKNTK